MANQIKLGKVIARGHRTDPGLQEVGISGRYAGKRDLQERAGEQRNQEKSRARYGASLR